MNFLRRYARSRLALLAAVVLALLLLGAVFAPWIAPQNPYALDQLDILDARLPPGEAASDGHLVYRLGSDEQGRDMLSAMLYGLRISLGVGFVATAIALLVGGAIGIVAGQAGGRVEALLMRLADIQLSFPAILVALVLIAVLRPGVQNVVIALVASQWAYHARTARSAALVERGKDYVTAARAFGVAPWRIALRHLLPNCLPPLVVVAALQVANAIALEATLSFLGLGVPVTEPSLGMLIANGQQYLLSGKYWISLYPGLLLLVTIVAVNLVADRVRELLDPRGRR
nr:ABC transporter permease [Derxia gummosa]